MNCRKRLPSNEQFAEAIATDHHATEALKTLCEKGCTRALVVGYLWTLSILPRRRQKLYPECKLKAHEKDIALVVEIANSMRKLVGPDGPLRYLIDFGTEQSIRERLIAAATELRLLIEEVRRAYYSPRASSRLLFTPYVYDFIPWLTKYVTDRTGRPHHNELATLIGFALGNSSFGTEQLKMICARRKSHNSRSNGRHQEFDTPALSKAD